ncbi:MAG: NAD(P)H-dependent oxidoreductase subunit E [Acidobacteria bacterium]|nr:NAD(P)H-dependent oxidoreductase subunit E [Acidobacteriota bacterium]
MGNENITACACQEDVPLEELLTRVDPVIEQYRQKPGGLIPALQIVQGIIGYLPEEAIKRIASGFGKSFSEVAGVVGFYSFFSTTPRGRHVIRVCLGTACYVRGAGQVLEAIKRNLQIDVGETTKDRIFSLEVARCFGACGLAPAIMVDEDVHHRVKPSRVGDIFERYRLRRNGGEAVIMAERSAAL